MLKSVIVGVKFGYTQKNSIFNVFRLHTNTPASKVAWKCHKSFAVRFKLHHSYGEEHKISCGAKIASSQGGCGCGRYGGHGRHGGQDGHGGQTQHCGQYRHGEYAEKPLVTWRYFRMYKGYLVGMVNMGNTVDMVDNGEQHTHEEYAEEFCLLKVALRQGQTCKNILAA